jgi:hypothetical protein
MSRLLRSLVLAVPVLAALACGGRVDGVGGGACPVPASIQNGVACYASGQSCPSAESGCLGNPVECSCSGGAWSCVLPPCVPPPVCPTTTTAGSACPASEQGCVASATIEACGVTTTVSCDCQQGAWVCEGTGKDCPDAQACPSPSSVQEGDACDVSGMSCASDDPIVDCNGDITGYYSCNCAGGSWQCPFPPVMSCDAGGPCPQPTDVVMDTACPTDGQQCPGNPQNCGGQVLYDAFQCEQGLWQDVAVTYCDLDAGQ